jgi:hypothetical protein
MKQIKKKKRVQVLNKLRAREQTFEKEQRSIVKIGHVFLAVGRDGSIPCPQNRECENRRLREHDKCVHDDKDDGKDPAAAMTGANRCDKGRNKDKRKLEFECETARQGRTRDATNQHPLNFQSMSARPIMMPACAKHLCTRNTARAAY